eukprot:Gb_35357 [translate_table: standard]
MSNRCPDKERLLYDQNFIDAHSHKNRPTCAQPLYSCTPLPVLAKNITENTFPFDQMWNDGTGVA